MGLTISANFDLIFWGRNFKYVTTSIIFIIFLDIYQDIDNYEESISAHDIKPFLRFFNCLFSFRFLTAVRILKSPR